MFTALGAIAAPAPAGPAPRDLPALVTALDAPARLSRKSVEALLGVRLDCSRYGMCDGPSVQLGGTRIGRIHFWAATNESVLTLDKVEGTCVRAEAIRINAAFGPPMSGCTDGVICMYRSARRPWGELHLGLPPTPGEPQCVRSVVFSRSR